MICKYTTTCSSRKKQFFYVFVFPFFYFFILSLTGSFFLEHGLYDCSKIVYQSIDIVDLNGNIDHNVLSIAFEVALRYNFKLHFCFVNYKLNITNSLILIVYAVLLVITLEAVVLRV